MSLELEKYTVRASEAVRAFWQSRDAAVDNQYKAGVQDIGGRSAVTAGKHMDGFLSLLADIVLENGLASAEIHQRRQVLTLPGYFRPSKQWDLLVTFHGKLVCAVELKSQVGPSFGNNFNNRAEEAVGAAHDFWSAWRSGAFGNQRKPFVGWLILVEDEPKSRSPVKESSPHFPVFNEFVGTSYLERYDLLCRKLMQERLYTAAALLAAPRVTDASQSFTSISQETSLDNFIAALERVDTSWIDSRSHKFCPKHHAPNLNCSQE